MKADIFTFVRENCGLFLLRKKQTNSRTALLHILIHVLNIGSRYSYKNVHIFYSYTMIKNNYIWKNNMEFKNLLDIHLV